MPDRVGNPKDRFSHDVTHVSTGLKGYISHREVSMVTLKLSSCDNNFTIQAMSLKKQEVLLLNIF